MIDATVGDTKNTVANFFGWIGKKAGIFGRTEEVSQEAITECPFANCRLRQTIIIERRIMKDHVFESLLAQVNETIARSGTSENFDARKWLEQWITQPVPALGGKSPLELLDNEKGIEQIKQVIAAMESNAYL